MKTQSGRWQQWDVVVVGGGRVGEQGAVNIGGGSGVGKGQRG